MFLAFFAWYAGLARGGVAKIGQVQLAQALLTLGWSALLLGEHVGAAHAARGGGRAGLRGRHAAQPGGGPRSTRAALRDGATVGMLDC